MATMKEVLEYARRNVLNDYPWNTAQDWEDDDGGLLWPNADLAVYLNRAMRGYAERVPIIDGSTASICQLAVSAATFAEISFDSRILRIKQARLQNDPDKRPLGETFLDHLDAEEPAWRNDRATDSIYSSRLYVQDEKRQTLTLIGDLPADDTLLLVVERVPLTELAWPDDKDEEIPDVPAHHHIPELCWGMGGLAYLKGDATNQTYQPQRAEHFRVLFDAAVGRKPDAHDQYWRRRFSNMPPRTRSHYR